MDPKLRAYLESIGLKAGATDSEGRIFMVGLKGVQLEKATRLAAESLLGVTLPASGAEMPPVEPVVEAPAAPVAPAVDPAAAANEPAGPAVPAPAAATPAFADAAVQQQIEQIGQLAGLEGDEMTQFVNTFRLHDDPVESARKNALERMEANMPGVDGGRTPSIGVGDDGRVAYNAALGASILAEFGVDADDGTAEANADEQLVGRMTGQTAVGKGRMWLASLGVDTMARGLTDEDVARCMMDPRELSAYGLGSVAVGHSTGDFTGVLSNVASKSLVKAFEEEETTFQFWAGEKKVPNLHEHEMHSMGRVPMPKRVGEFGDYELVYFGEKKEKARAIKHGLRVGISLEMIIQDTMNAFGEEVMDFAASARRLDNYLVYKQLTDNGVMVEDGKAMFHADHGNLAAAGAAISKASLSAARKMLRRQRGIKNKEGVAETLRITPSFLLCPEEVVDDADQLVASAVDPTKSNATPNYRFVRNLTVLSDPELDDVSTTAWWLMGPRRQSCVKKVKMKGYDIPQIRRSKMQADDAVYFQLRYFTGAASAEYRTAVKNPGS